MDCPSFAETLNKALVERGVSRDQAGRSVGIGSRQFRDWTNGVRTPNPFDLYNLAVILGVPYTYLSLVVLLDTSPVEARDDVVHAIRSMGWPVPSGVEQKLPSW